MAQEAPANPANALLIVLQQAPASGSLPRAALDMLMSFAVFAQEPSVLFAGPAVHALVSSDSAASGRRSLRKVIDSLPLYDVDEIYVDAQSLTEAGIDADALPAFARVLSGDDVVALRSSAGRIVSL